MHFIDTFQAIDWWVAAGRCRANPNYWTWQFSTVDNFLTEMHDLFQNKFQKNSDAEANVDEYKFRKVSVQTVWV